jgi:outer membrane lipoprotein-sorting protein
MKKIGTLLLCVFCFTVFAGAETLDEVLAKNYEAKGGLDKLKAVNSVKVTGKMEMGGGMEAPFTYYWQRPNKMRNEFTIQGKTGVQAFDGETGWMFMPFMGKTEAEKMPDELSKNMEDEADFEGSLVDWQEKGHQVELIGKESIVGTEADKHKVVRKSGSESIIYLDAEYYLEIKEESKREINGQEIEMETSTGDYKEVGGLMLPHSVTTQAKGAPGGQAITFETIELNIDLDPSIFTMPEAEVKAETDETKE